MRRLREDDVDEEDTVPRGPPRPFTKRKRSISDSDSDEIEPKKAKKYGDELPDLLGEIEGTYTRVSPQAIRAYLMLEKGVPVPIDGPVRDGETYSGPFGLFHFERGPGPEERTMKKGYSDFREFHELKFKGKALACGDVVVSNRKRAW